MARSGWRRRELEGGEFRQARERARRCLVRYGHMCNKGGEVRCSCKNIGRVNVAGCCGEGVECHLGGEDAQVW